MRNKSTQPLILGVFACATLAASVAAATPSPKVYPDAKLQITLPDGWGVKDAKNGITMAGAPKDDAGLIVFPVVNPTPEGVKKAVDGLITAMKITGATWDADVKKDTINSLPIFGRKGTGTSDGKADDLSAILVMNGAAGLVVVGVVQHDRKDAYKAAMTGAVLSIQATK